MTTFKALLTSLLALVLAILAFSASPAFAQSPWWHLSSGALPTNIKPGVARNEVQDVKVSATEGTFYLVIQAGPGAFVEVPYDDCASPSSTGCANGGTGTDVQSEINKALGAEDVTVTGGPGDATGSKPYVVEFMGGLADQTVPLMLSGAEVTEVAHGQPDGQIVVTATNLGDAPVEGATNPLTITDTLPPGLEAVAMEAFAGQHTFGPTGEDGPVQCKVKVLTCIYGEAGDVLPPFREIEVLISVKVKEGAQTGESNEASVSGGAAGGGGSVSVKHPVTISDTATPFGVEGYELTAEEEGGAADTLAGSHPFQLTTTFNLNDIVDQSGAPAPAQLTKDLHFKWPAGLVGNPTPIPRCTLGLFLKVKSPLEVRNACPADTAVGVALTTIHLPGENYGPGAYTFTDPVFNLEPEQGEPAKFGFLVPGAPIYINPSVRDGQDYGIDVNVENITEEASFLRSSVTIWGVPGEPEHDISRGNCITPGAPVACDLSEAQQSPPAFLALPTSCTGLMASTMTADSWEAPGVLTEPVGEPMGALHGCNRLPFEPSIAVTPGVTEASKPSGLKVDVHVPQQESLNPNGLSEADPRDITVTLPEGLALNPSAANGLQACNETQVGYKGENHQTGAQEFEPEVYDSETGKDEPTACPDASKIATATIKTPLLANPLTGSVYLAAPQNFRGGLPQNPFASLVAMYLVVDDPAEGVLIKLAGKVALSESGQVTATFENSPQAPFEDATLEFFGGERAPLATPALCRRPGEAGYQTLASFTPWSDTATDQDAFPAAAEFDIDSGPGGGPCPNPRGDQSPGALPFDVTLASGTANVSAGAFSALTTTLSRGEDNQNIQSVTLHYPAGLSGLLSSVKLCGEAEANAGTCGSESQIGETIISVGVGGDPFTVTGGKVYITGPYEGAPFGLSIVNPAKAGPFDLQEGRPVVVRAKIEVNPLTAALTITTNGAGQPYHIPTIIEGFHLQIQHVNVNITRPGFTFNPTNCNPAKVTGTVNSAEGASSPVEVPFQVHDCASLKFTPKFAVSTSGKTSKAGGASLTAKVTEPVGALGTQANIARVKVDLPKQLPSRLTTLQKACTNAQFEANPADCPSASKIGYAKVTTPLLPVPLEGPAIFVSHGGEAFPSLTMVLQGYGVTVDLVGTTFISHAGITSTTFKTVPDVPFNTFTLTLPEGKYSALAANGNLCTSKLAMPTEFLAQNGAKINESTPVGVTGCAKAKALTRAQKLQKALKACDKKAKAKRAGCRAKAHKQFGPVKAKKKGKKK
jgi:hypothetical protein